MIDTGQFLADLFSRKHRLEELKKSLNTFDQDKLFNSIATVESFYPIKENYGKHIYSQSSVIWKVATYFPYLKQAIGFVSYYDLGNKEASLDPERFKVYLKKDLQGQLEKTDLFISKHVVKK